MHKEPVMGSHYLPHWETGAYVARRSPWRAFCMNMFKFFKKKIATTLTDEQLRMKAAGANFAIFTISDDIRKTMQEQVRELQNLKQEDINRIFFIISYNVLFQAQKFYWENFIPDESNARSFEKHLFRLFKKTFGVDPMPHIKDLVDYVESGDRGRELQYIGSKICKTLDKEDAFLMFNISAVFIAYLKHGFYESMKRAWEIPDSVLKDMLEKIEPGSLKI